MSDFLAPFIILPFICIVSTEGHQTTQSNESQGTYQVLSVIGLDNVCFFFFLKEMLVT